MSQSDAGKEGDKPRADNPQADKAPGEFELIRTFFQHKPPRHPDTVLGIGDDCALLEIPDGQQLAVSTDTLITGRHFPEDASPGDIATRAFCVCVSDLAAMGANPRWFSLALSLPEADSHWLRAFSESLHIIADEYGCELVGGDTTKGELSLTLSVKGLVSKGRALLRSGAQTGELVCVTGSLGDGAAALAHLQGRCAFETNYQAYLQQRFYRPEPQVQAGLALSGLASAAIDISDGLLADLGHIARASGVSIGVQAEKLPLSPALASIDREQAITWALTGGDDYQLAFTLAVESREEAGIPFHVIGEVVATKGEEPQVIATEHGKLWGLNNRSDNNPTTGYQHFAP